MMKNKIMLVLLVVCLAMSAQAGIATIAFNNASADDGALNSATETFTTTVSGFNGTTASFDLVVTAVADSGVWVDKNGDLGIASDASTNDHWDELGENGDFTVTIANFLPGDSGYTVGDVDFGMRILTLNADGGGSDSGTFDLINGVGTSLTWLDGNTINAFPGDGDCEFDLQVMNAGVRVTSFSLNHAGGSSNAWRVKDLDIEYVHVPEPATMSLLALGGLAMLRRRRRA